MIVGSLCVRMALPGAHSLKEKRMVVKSLVARLQNKFHLSVAEVDEQDRHQTIVLGIACVSGTAAQCQRVLDQVLHWLDGASEAQVTQIEREIL